MSKPKISTRQVLGYARVSTKDQKLDRQLISLKEYGCDVVFTDKATGNNRDRKGLKSMLQHLRAGDTIVFHEIDRISRSLKDLLDIIGEIEAKGANIKILSGIGKGLDTTDPLGRALFSIGAIFSELESAIRRQRAYEGVQAKMAKDPNYIHGRGSKAKVKKYDEVVKLHKEGFNNSQISRKLEITRHTVIKALKIYKAEQEGE